MLQETLSSNISINHYNGLQNVGKEVKVYLKGTSTLALSNPTWGFSSKPAGSNAAFGAVKDC